MAIGGYSVNNVATSLAYVLANVLLGQGYLLYWTESDVVQVSPTVLKYNYSTSQATYLADSGYQAALAASRGLLTIRPEKSAIERVLVRPTVDGTVEDQSAVKIPALSLTVGVMVSGANYELGGQRKWRLRALAVEMYARSLGEQTDFADTVSETFDNNTPVDVLDHDTGTMAVVGSVLVQRPIASRETSPDGEAATTYKVTLNAVLEYVA